MIVQVYSLLHGCNPRLIGMLRRKKTIEAKELYETIYYPAAEPRTAFKTLVLIGKGRTAAHGF